MSIADIAGLVAAVAFAALVAFLAVPLLKLGTVLDEARVTLRELTTHTVPVIDDAAESVRLANAQLVKVDDVTTPAAEAAQNISAMTTLVAATVARPLIKAAAFSEAVRRVVFRGKART
ncbi:MAG: DUF948 domain-containing protein [Actinomycetales bacterium]|jgi:Bacterial protein of unknown function (DUF948).|nr:DUF948 domain-containing protein [Actinomycetales bacterium]